MKFKNRLIILLTIILFTIASELIFLTSAEAVTQNFQWTGLQGYSVRGTFSYDETKVTQIISEKGAGQTDYIQSLLVTFYAPSGEPISQYENVVNSQSKGKYFEFAINKASQQLWGRIDLGGEQSGELFFKGIADRQLSLIEIEPSGEEHVLDSDRSF